MAYQLTTNVWLDVLALYLSPVDICALCCVNRFFERLFAAPRYWKALVREALPDLAGPLEGLELPYKTLYTQFYPHLDHLKAHLSLMALSHAASLPLSSPAAAAFFLYFHWNGTSQEQRILKLPLLSDEVDLVRQTVTLRLHFANQLPLLSYGYQGVYSRVELVMVNRRVAGNRKVVGACSNFRHTLKSPEYNVNVIGDAYAEEERQTKLFQMLMFVSTPSKSQYKQLGKFCHGDEDYFFHLAAARSAGLTHGEARRFSSSDVVS
jgi:hypothetical protein